MRSGFGASTGAGSWGNAAFSMRAMTSGSSVMPVVSSFFSAFSAASGTFATGTGTGTTAGAGSVAGAGTSAGPL